MKGRINSNCPLVLRRYNFYFLSYLAIQLLMLASGWLKFTIRRSLMIVLIVFAGNLFCSIFISLIINNIDSAILRLAEL